MPTAIVWLALTRSRHWPTISPAAWSRPASPFTTAPEHTLATGSAASPPPLVTLDAARHRLPVRARARWLLALGIAAPLAAKVVHGWSHGRVGALVAALPAASLVGSYGLLLWIIRTNATRRLACEPSA